MNRPVLSALSSLINLGMIVKFAVIRYRNVFEPVHLLSVHEKKIKNKIKYDFTQRPVKGKPIPRGPETQNRRVYFASLFSIIQQIKIIVTVGREAYYICLPP